MALLLENKPRRVIPNWRDFKRTAKLGELDSDSKKAFQKSYDKTQLTENINDWKSNKSIAFAADLVNSAFILNIVGVPEVNDAAKYILDNGHQASVSLLKVSNSILNINTSLDEEEILLENSSFMDYEDNLIWTRIAILKKTTADFPKNPIAWAELSRQYSLLGQNDKAKNAMLISLRLNKHNRYITRSAARLFAHINDIELAHSLVRNNEATKYDPWLISTEIALASIQGRFSKFAKIGLNIINSGSRSNFDVTELVLCNLSY